MEPQVPPRNYPEWRSGQFNRSEDAAHLFGYYLIMHCRDEAMGTLSPGVAPDVKDVVEKAVDIALHNVCAMLEGFWRLNAGPNHQLSLALAVQVRNVQNQVLETVDISPSRLDLPIGYWKWARDREFR
jgi:hypothetical protein